MSHASNNPQQETESRGGAVPVEVVRESACTFRPDIGAILAHPCTYVLIGFAAGVWFKHWMDSKK